MEFTSKEIEKFEKEENIKTIISVFVILALIVISIMFSVIAHNEAKKTDAIVNGALEDMNLNRSDFSIIELKIFEGTNVFVLRLDDRLLLGSFDKKEDGIYVDVIKEI